MTADEKNGVPAPVPAWAEGLDLIPKRVRASDGTLKRIIEHIEDAASWRIVLRRLADAEMRLAELAADRGEPDFLIESDGTRWERVGQDMYQLPGDPGFRPSREKIERSSEGPVTEAWKGRK